jgi:hypothetical protein
LRFLQDSSELAPMSTEPTIPDAPCATGFEWKSPWNWMGYPWIHVAVGQTEDGKLRVARGIFAIGQRAKGFFAFGMVATGFFSCGILSLGIFSAGVVGIGLFAAVGLNAAAPFAYGLCAVGGRAKGLAPLILSF